MSVTVCVCVYCVGIAILTNWCRIQYTYASEWNISGVQSDRKKRNYKGINIYSDSLLYLIVETVVSK